MRQRLKQLALRLQQRAAISSAPAAQAWAQELTHLTVRKLHWSIGGYVNRLLFERPQTRATPSAEYFERLANGEPRLHIIVVPNVLHFLVPTIRLLPNCCTKGFVLNGAAHWEAEVLRQRFPDIPQVRLPTVPGVPLQHGAVVDWLLGLEQVPFGLLDHDLFVLDPSLFEALEFRDDECMLGLYSIENKALGIRFPTTHFLYLHTLRLSALVYKHRLSCRTSRRVPSRLRSLLSPIGLSPRVYLKSYLDYFDTMNLLMATVLAEGWRWRILDQFQRSCIHIGGTSGQRLLAEPLGATYIGLKLLQSCDDAHVRQRYTHLYQATDPDTLLEDAAQGRKEDVMRLSAAADQMLERLERRLAEVDAAINA